MRAKKAKPKKKPKRKPTSKPKGKTKRLAKPKKGDMPPDKFLMIRAPQDFRGQRPPKRPLD